MWLNKCINFFGLDKKYIMRQLKVEIKKFDDSIEELIAYQNSLDYTNLILKNLLLEDENKRTELFKEIIKLQTLSSIEIRNLAKKNDAEILYNALKSHYQKYTREESILLKKMLVRELERPNLSNIENVAFSGGGAKGIAHVGTIRKLEEAGAEIKAVSGTSAGAITALPYALGYKPNKIAEIVANYDFTSFLQESILNGTMLGNLVKMVSSSKRALMYRTIYFETFKKAIEEPFLKFLIAKGKDESVLKLKYPSYLKTKNEKLKYLSQHFKSEFFTISDRRLLLSGVSDTDLNSIILLAEEKARKAFRKEIIENEKNITVKELEEKLSLGFKSTSEALQTFFRLYRKEDVIEEFFGDLIENKISHINKEKLELVSEGFSKIENIRKMNFKQFEKLRELCPEENFKDIGICICQKVNDNPLYAFSKDNYQQIDVHSNNENKEYAEMPIKTAVRISMNLPGAFSSYKYNGKKYVDGGVRANFPLHFFDKTKGIPRSKTLGFALAPEDNYTRTKDVNNLGKPESPSTIMETRPFVRFIKKITRDIGHYYNQKIYGQKLDNNNPFDHIDLLRVGIINVLDVGTNDFNLSKTAKIKLMQQGYKTCKNVLSQNYEAQLYHYKERVKALKNKIKKIESNSVFNDTKLVDNLYENNYNNIAENMANPILLELENNNKIKQNFFKRVKNKKRGII